MSFYFDKNGITPNGRTILKMDQLLNLLNDHYVQFIEINSFADIDGDGAENKALARKRQEFIIDYFEIEDENLVVNTYGAERIELDFNPENWHRVDVYFYIGMKKYGSKSRVTYDTIPAQYIDSEKRAEEERQRREARKNVIAENIPIVLPIAFIGGTDKIADTSYSYIQELFDLIQANKHLKGHLRGHVCCEDNMLQSKKRAKVIYKFLIEMGVDDSRLSFKGYSNEEPLVYPEKTPKDRQANRRVDIVFSRISKD